jgi:hypothetical protein
VAITNQQVFSPKEGKFVDSVVPQALDVAGIKAIIQDAVKGARNAMEAGFDGVELHCANGEFFCQIQHSQSLSYRLVLPLGRGQEATESDMTFELFLAPTQPAPSAQLMRGKELQRFLSRGVTE